MKNFLFHIKAFFSWDILFFLFLSALPIFNRINESLIYDNLWYHERTGLHKLADVIFGVTPKPFYIASSNYNPGQNICNKIAKVRKTVQVKRSLMFFGLLLPKFKFLKGDWPLGYVFAKIWDFPNISLFLKTLSLKSFCNSRGNLYTKFAILDTAFHFTCG